MENFIVSARKYRPATFDTVVGQHSITSTLKNAIRNHHLAQAFLFCGPRGVGKTTCARILAKTINCFHITPETEACDQCESCKSFNSGQSLNVYELDAASNNSVDDIRNLVDQVRFAPQLGSHKVYIIDEVHMLSQAAFNAFLKTLEEPPKHAIFILATTEKHKIIPTILSRCQIFDFNRIQVDDIAQHLNSIAQKENIGAEPDALHIIAQKADGALRDALSIFDRIVSFSGEHISYKAVIENLNILDYDYYFKVTDAIKNSDIPQCLLIFNDILNNGFDGHNFIVGLGEHFRNLMVCKDQQTLSLLEVGNNIKEKYKEQSQSSDIRFLLKALDIINRCDQGYKTSKNQRLQVELALMQLCSLTSPNNAGEQEKKSEIIPASPLTSPTKASQAIKTVKQETSEPIIAKEVAAPSLTKKTIISSSASISSITAKKKEAAPATTAAITDKSEIASSIGQTPSNTFTTEQLQAAWVNYAKFMQEKGKMNFFATLSSYAPLLKEDGISIEFTIENKAQEEEMELEKADFLAFLRKELSNYSIQLSTIIVKNESEKKVYTPSDKYKRMAEKNPTLNKLKQKFDLEIEY